MIMIMIIIIGMWDIDPEDSDWYHLVSKDKNDPNSKEVAMGSICFR